MVWVPSSRADAGTSDVVGLGFIAGTVAGDGLGGNGSVASSATSSTPGVLTAWHCRNGAGRGRGQGRGRRPGATRSQRPAGNTRPGGPGGLRALAVCQENPTGSRTKWGSGTGGVHQPVRMGGQVVPPNSGDLPRCGAAAELLANPWQERLCGSIFLTRDLAVSLRGRAVATLTGNLVRRQPAVIICAQKQTTRPASVRAAASPGKMTGPGERESRGCGSAVVGAHSAASSSCGD
jgi:hypothetical protein